MRKYRVISFERGVFTSPHVVLETKHAISAAAEARLYAEAHPNQNVYVEWSDTVEIACWETSYKMPNRGYLIPDDYVDYVEIQWDEDSSLYYDNQGNNRLVCKW